MTTTTEGYQDVVPLQQEESSEDRVVRRDGAFGSVLRGLLWPFSVVVRAYRGFWWLLGIGRPGEAEVEVEVVSPAAVTPARHSLSGRKRISRLTRMLLWVLPRWVQGALGYPVSSSIGRTLSPEVSISPTKLHGKGSKRKQDEMEDDDDEEPPSWVDALNQELHDEGPDVDPDYEPSNVETESEEYRSHNDTESDVEVSEGGLVHIEDVKTDVTITEVSGPVV